jgi:hypothetical protein
MGDGEVTISGAPALASGVFDVAFRRNRHQDREGHPRIVKVDDRLFEGEEAVFHVIERIVAPLDLRVDAASPWVEARLSDGSRVQTNFLSTPFRAMAYDGTYDSGVPDARRVEMASAPESARLPRTPPHLA